MKQILFGCIVSLLLFNQLSYAKEQNGLIRYLITKAVSPYIEMRPRIESVNQDKKGLAITNQLKMGLSSSALMGLSNWYFKIETIHVNRLNNDFHSGSLQDGFNDTKATIEDPAANRLSQAYIQYKLNSGIVTLGDKQLQFDDGRFIGYENWRQMPSSFGLFSIEDVSLNKELSVSLYSIYRHRGALPEDIDYYSKGSYFIRGQYNVSKTAVQLQPFAYLIQNNHDTMGIRVSNGSTKKMEQHYFAEVAIQKTASIKSIGVSSTTDAMFFRLGASDSWLQGRVKASYSLFGKPERGASRGFSLPFSSKHEFDGWTDSLSALINNGAHQGIHVFSGSIEAPFLKGYLKGQYVRFYMQENGTLYGSEINLGYRVQVKQWADLFIQTGFFIAGNAVNTIKNKTTVSMGLLCYL